MTCRKENGESEVETEVEERHNRQTGCGLCLERLKNLVRPILLEYHPMPFKPTRLQRFKNSLYCPPHGRIGAVLFVIFVGFIWWGVLWALTDKEALPGGNLFSLFLLFFFCWCGGYLIRFIRLPPLLGMLLVGGILGNVPGIDIARNIDHTWGSGCRQIALAIILVRAGLGLDPAALRRLSFVVIRLAFSPCLTETITDGIAAHFILGFPWQWGFMLGFVIAAVSPAVVVPSLLSLAERGYGIDKGVPTLVIAAASVDDVLAITGFSVLIGITFSSGDLAWNIIKGPIEAIVGIVLGTVMGLILWYLPQKKSNHLILFRSAMLVGFSLLAIFGSTKVEWSGSGPLAVLTLAFVSALRWRKEYTGGEKNAAQDVEDVVGVLWMIFQPLLFGLIAANVQVGSLEAKTVGLGIAVLGIGLGVRCCVAFLSVLGTDLNFKERLFIPPAWLPKATVQAAIGGIAYSMAVEAKNDEFIDYGETILQLAVLSILLTAPTGAAIVALLGPLLLHHTPATERKFHSVEALPIQEDPEECPVKDIDCNSAGLVRSTSLDSVSRRNNAVDKTENSEDMVTQF